MSLVALAGVDIPEIKLVTLNQLEDTTKAPAVVIALKRANRTLGRARAGHRAELFAQLGG